MSKLIRMEPNHKGRLYRVVRCDCGEEVHCNDAWANSCECGQEFNGSGQRLAPRSQWGEETGEQF